MENFHVSILRYIPSVNNPFTNLGPPLSFSTIPILTCMSPSLVGSPWQLKPRTCLCGFLERRMFDTGTHLARVQGVCLLFLLELGSDDTVDTFLASRNKSPIMFYLCERPQILSQSTVWCQGSSKFLIDENWSVSCWQLKLQLVLMNLCCSTLQGCLSLRNFVI